jgi:hypothetical protein
MLRGDGVRGVTRARSGVECGQHPALRRGKAMGDDVTINEPPSLSFPTPAPRSVTERLRPDPLGSGFAPDAGY